ncbi:metallophosphoesterase [Petroclostridium sp. X23]|uniref:metallophosphoesterase n=1 Tax=Petroclostridium sp. X23 TaxID=3045146 RepID=UPI0024AE4821|nr:metallophosphoesterase [Petroclostridium sp. X23]WHH58613.1 metallophosphoesterase [Petroclostridium sp. X23]
MLKLRLKQWTMMIILGVVFMALCKMGTYYFIIPALACFAYGLIEPYRIENKETYYAHNKIPEAFENFKIVFVSDIHHGIVYSSKRVRALVNRINLLKPDLILLGGDYVDQKKYIQTLFKEMKNLEATHGVYGILGNHDHRAGAKILIDAMEKAGISCLDNKAVWLHRGRDRIRIGGVGDFWNDIQDVNPTIEGVDNEFVILLSHNPDYAENIKTDKIDLVLSGHTHGGQGTIFGLWAPFMTSRHGQKYRSGLVKLPYTEVLVSNGIGNVGCIPIRFFARPQINIIYLKRKHDIGNR